MALFRYTFPIPNHYNNGITEQHVYFESTSCPSPDQISKELKEKHEAELVLAKKHPDWGPFLFEYQACLTAIAQIEGKKRLPVLKSSQISGNVFCETDFGRHPLSIYKIEPISI